MEDLDEKSISWLRRAKFVHTVARSSSDQDLLSLLDGQHVPHSRSYKTLADPETSLQSTSISTVSSMSKFHHSASEVSLSQSSFSDSKFDSDQEAVLKHENGLGSKMKLLSISQSSLWSGSGQATDVISEKHSESSFYCDSRHSVSLPDVQPISGSSGDRRASLRTTKSEKTFDRKPRSRHRSMSPIPASIVPDDIRAASKRFSSPPLRRKSWRKGNGNHNGASPQSNGARQRKLHGNKSPERKKEKDNSWCTNFQETLQGWTIDRSKLLIGQKFASGAHSKLYHGYYKEQPVAVKFIRQPDGDSNGELSKLLEKQFIREVTILSHLHHRNVIKLVGAFSSPPVFCVITEYLPGGSLRGFLHRHEQERRSIPPDQLISIALDVTQGMEYIHSQGVMHRDLKPENVIFDENFCAKIVDFGIACEVSYCDTLEEDPGTYRWMAPEMIKHIPYDKKVDVYSFGLLLWEMATGAVPYEDMTPVQAAFAVVDKKMRPPIPDDCPAALHALIEQCWSTRPDKRPEFWQIVHVLEKFKNVLAQGRTLNELSASALLEHNDHKSWLSSFIQKLKRRHDDGTATTAAVGPLPPRLM